MMKIKYKNLILKLLEQIKIEKYYLMNHKYNNKNNKMKKKKKYYLMNHKHNNKNNKMKKMN